MGGERADIASGRCKHSMERSDSQRSPASAPASAQQTEADEVTAPPTTAPPAVPAVETVTHEPAPPAFPEPAAAQPQFETGRDPEPAADAAPELQPPAEPMPEEPRNAYLREAFEAPTDAEFAAIERAHFEMLERETTQPVRPIAVPAYAADAPVTDDAPAAAIEPAPSEPAFEPRPFSVPPPVVDEAAAEVPERRFDPASPAIHDAPPAASMEPQAQPFEPQPFDAPRFELKSQPRSPEVAPVEPQPKPFEPALFEAAPQHFDLETGPDDLGETAPPAPMPAPAYEPQQPPPPALRPEPAPDRMAPYAASLEPVAAAAPTLVAEPRPDIYAPTVPRRDWRDLARRAAHVAFLAFTGWFIAVLALIGVYRFVNPPFSMLMAQRWLTGTSISKQWVPMERISPNLARAVIVSEDGRFCQHWGIDFVEAANAIKRAADGYPRGASTITMQVAKNLFLLPAKSYVRKMVEIPLTFAIELAWSKRRILEVYLNIVEWGPGIFGAEAASRAHFGRAASSLTARQAAQLAAVLPNPIVRDAGAPGPRTARKASIVQARAARAREASACVDVRR